MSANSAIEWTDATWNPTAGCSIVSPGCHHCYAARLAERLAAMGQGKYDGTTKDGKWTGKINLDEAALSIPLKRKKPTTYFVDSMSDLFHDSVPFEFVDKVFAVMALCPQHTFQVLTKRAERAYEYLTVPPHRQGVVLVAAKRLGGTHAPTAWPLPNVWLGVSAEDQQRADERIPWLLKTPAAVRFVSAEPLLGPVKLQSSCTLACQNQRQCELDPDSGHRIIQDSTEGGLWVECACSRLGGLDWVIVGGESGPRARPMHPDWPRSIRDQCIAAGVSFFFKQWGEWAACESWHGLGPRGRPPQICVGPDGDTAGGFLGTLGDQRKAEGWVARERVGKKAAGRVLDGRTWDQFPETSCCPDQW